MDGVWFSLRVLLLGVLLVRPTPVRAQSPLQAAGAPLATVTPCAGNLLLADREPLDANEPPLVRLSEDGWFDERVPEDTLARDQLPPVVTWVESDWLQFVVQDGRPRGTGGAETVIAPTLNLAIDGGGDSRSERTRFIPGVGIAPAAEAPLLPSSDAGGFLEMSSGGFGIGEQMRNPVVIEVRPRSHHVGQVLGSGSYWIPVRMDLDTMLSKLDSRIVGDIIVIKGPYSSRYGPAFSFIDFELLSAPRFADGPHSGGSSKLEYKTNGARWYGRQSVWAGAENYGVRVSYGHKTGSDYRVGGQGALIDPLGVLPPTDRLPSSYNSRDVELAIGADVSPTRHLDFHYLRLDQTDMEYPGQIFDMDYLGTDAFEAKWIDEDPGIANHLTFEAWYNHTRFNGNAQRAGKRSQIPQLNPLPPPIAFAPGQLNFFGLTDAFATSAGFSSATTWGESGETQFTLGADLRFVEQELNEFDQFIQGGLKLGNFPIPRSQAINPGLFVELIRPSGDRLTITGGARVDLMWTDAGGAPGQTAPPSLNAISPRTRDALQTSLGGQFNQSIPLASAFLTGRYEIDDACAVTAGCGYAMRPPTLTELYAFQPFMAILQQGFTFVTGNPNLDPAQNLQFDLGLTVDRGRLRGGIHAFHAQIHDFITFEAAGELDIAQGRGLNVKFVNTDLATLTGAEAHGEYDWTQGLTSFATMSYVDGRDQTRRARGTVPGAPQEPLWQIPPLETVAGIRLHSGDENPTWAVEFAARIVNEQARVASSLLEQRTPGFTIYQIRGYWHATDHLLLVGGVENLGDKFYREHLDMRTGRGVFQPGVNFYFSSELTY